MKSTGAQSSNELQIDYMIGYQDISSSNGHQALYLVFVLVTYFHSTKFF